ncbi:MAG TPA: hypothetical protein VFE85_06220 [Woeseiaceae bacterium]|nr:hypothetical protein [Woeseiaceae bacterium]
MKIPGMLAVALLLVSAAAAQEPAPGDAAKTAKSVTDVDEAGEETAAAQKARMDEAVANAVEEYNEDAESDLDKIVCTRERVTGSRTKKRVCRTVREIELEKAATERALRQRNRGGTLPADVEGQSQR